MSRCRAPRLLIVGCGDVGLRFLRQQQTLIQAGRLRVFVLTSSASRIAELRALGATPILGNLDHAASLRRLAALADRVLMLAPPRATEIPQGSAAFNKYKNMSCSGSFDGEKPQKQHKKPIYDPRSAALQIALRRSRPPRQVVYASTSGVYGDCAGAHIDETQALRPQSERAARRVGAERIWRGSGLPVSVLRIPGIYALDRIDGTPATRLQKGTPVLAAADDVFTNHIHAEDLARACQLALWRARPQRTYHASDDSQLKMGEYFDLAAQLLGLPLPPRLPRAELEQVLNTIQLSFLRESRRLSNARIKAELGLRLAYPTPAQGLAQH
jgi:dTDP-4-dehydrorhamnose reductase